MSRVVIGLGSNLDDRARLLERAVEELGGAAGIQALSVSRTFETAPIGGPVGQAPFFNAAARFETNLSALQVWEILSEIEQRLGRQRTARWGPRSIDLDLLLYEELILNSPDLIVPHPRLAVRRFVLEPAVEVAPMMIHPRIGWTITRLFEHLVSALPRLVVVGTSEIVRTKFVEDLRQRVPGDPAVPRWQITDADPAALVSSPKLVVLVEDPAELSAATRTLVECPGRGPWLIVDPTNWQRALDDVLAALAGMA